MYAYAAKTRPTARGLVREVLESLFNQLCWLLQLMAMGLPVLCFALLVVRPSLCYRSLSIFATAVAATYAIGLLATLDARSPA
jgi:hypothetical protein